MFEGLARCVEFPSWDLRGTFRTCRCNLKESGSCCRFQSMVPFGVPSLSGAVFYEGPKKWAILLTTLHVSESKLGPKVRASKSSKGSR